MKEAREMGLAQNKGKKKIRVLRMIYLRYLTDKPKIHIIYQKAQIPANFVTDFSNDGF